MKNEEIIDKIFEELERAEKKHPNWPGDPVHGAAILAEETGSAVKAALDFYYGRGKPNTKKLIKELTHSAAMAIRFLIHLE